MTHMNRTLPVAVLAVLALLAVTATRLVAQEHRGNTAAAHSDPAGAHSVAEREAGVAGEHHIGPVPPDVGITWPGLVMLIIGTMFVLAAVIGPLVRLHAPPPEMPPTHSQDEPPGASHHHGASGTLNPEPDHGHH